MKRSGSRSPLAVRDVVLRCSMLLTWLWFSSQAVVAQAPPPPPDTPIPTVAPTNTTAPTNTAAPTEAAAPTNTTAPTEAAAPTNTTAPANTPSSDKPSPTSTQEAEHSTKTSGAGSNPGCQALVEGYVGDASGRRTAGATVVIEGEGWSNRLMTDDSGHYGFGGLCAGSATLAATLPNGLITSASTVTLDGKSSTHLDLGFAPAAATAAGEATIASEATPTTEASMPTTGYSTWLLVGGAMMALVLLLSAGARRALSARERRRE